MTEPDKHGWTVPHQVGWYVAAAAVGGMFTFGVAFLIEEGREDVKIAGIADIQQQVVQNREKRGEMISNLRDDLQSQISDLRERVSALEAGRE